MCRRGGRYGGFLSPVDNFKMIHAILHQKIDDIVAGTVGLLAQGIQLLYQLLPHTQGPVSYTHLDVYKRQPQRSPFQRLPIGQV